MWLKRFTAILVGKTIFFLTRLLKTGGGSAAPGLYALKIYPDLVSDLASKIPNTVVITGTNGKTTTARILSHFAQAQGSKVIRNHTGSNLERGIASTLLAHLGGGFLRTPRVEQFDLAIWELDEAAFNQVALKLHPQVVVFLNVFRDQLDRYGEVDTIVKKWCQTVSKLPSSAQIFINGDDHNLHELKKHFDGKAQTFGIEGTKITGEKVIKAIKGKTQLDLEAKNIQPRGLNKIEFKINSQAITLPLAGVYNIYNFLAALACAQRLGIPDQTSLQSLKGFSPAFGRVEKFKLTPSFTPSRCQAKEGYIFLIKNPTGATQVLQTIKDEIKAEDCLLIALNDNLADGTDVSWIWDIEVEKFKIQKSKIKIMVSGTRAEDLSLRLKYAGFEPSSLQIINNLEKAFREALRGLNGQLFILPTYTALLELQHILAKEGIKKHYWKEQK